MALDRDDLIHGLRRVIAKLHERGEPAGIRIIGGAALSLRYFDRRTTDDIDAKLYPADPTLAAAVEVAAENNWPEDWLNSKADHFIPIARDVGWEPIYDDDQVSVWVASAPALLAMKLRASRTGRDDDDIANLLAICEIADIEQADAHYESFYPGEVLADNAYRLMTVLFDQGLPEKPDRPPAPDLG